MLKATVNKLARRFEFKNWLSEEVGTRSAETQLLKRMRSTRWRANPPSRGTCVGWRKGRQQPQETQWGQMRSPAPGTHSAPAGGQSQMPGWGELCWEGLGARRGWGTGLVGGEEKALGGPKSSPPILMRRLPRGQSLLGSDGKRTWDWAQKLTGGTSDCVYGKRLPCG